jgi:tripartite-type tricarboxylate transporter receptor subunit TctC
MFFRHLRYLATACAVLCVALSARADYPDRHIALVVPFPAGGSTDAIARVAAEHMGKQLGQTVIVDNRGGAGGAIAAEAVAQAPGDGYTLFLATTGTMAINPYIYKKLKYDPIRDFAPVGTLVSSSNVLVVHPSVKANSVKELIAMAKASPGKLTYASSGIGSSSHLSGALFAKMSGVDMLHVPYKGSGPAMSDFLAGRVDMMLDTTSTHAPNVKAGKVRALAITSAERSPLYPGIPTIAEAGVPGYDVTIWFGIVAPAGTPKAVIDKLSGALSAVLAMPSAQEALSALGTSPMRKSPAEFAEFIRKENEHWKEAVTLAGASDKD